MIEDVEELRPELGGVPLGKVEVLEEGEVQTMEARAAGGALRIAQNAVSADRDAARRSTRADHSPLWSWDEFAGLLEGLGVVEPEDASVPALNPEIWILPGNGNRVAAGPGGGAGWATKSNGLAALQGGDPVCGPASHQVVHGLRRRAQESLVGAERKVIGAA
jgi:hypothetical protein